MVLKKGIHECLLSFTKKNTKSQNRTHRFSSFQEIMTTFFLCNKKFVVPFETFTSLSLFPFYTHPNTLSDVVKLRFVIVYHKEKGNNNKRSIATTVVQSL